MTQFLWPNYDGIGYWNIAAILVDFTGYISFKNTVKLYDFDVRSFIYADILQRSKQ
jgi:hypothetical protein